MQNKKLSNENIKHMNETVGSNGTDLKIKTTYLLGTLMCVSFHLSFKENTVKTLIGYSLYNQ